MLSHPLVSVIVSNYNYGRFVKDAVRSALSQSYKNIECIVVDDCSTDESDRVLDEIAVEWPHVKIVMSTDNGGQSSSILKGLNVATGHFVLFLDADDVLLSDCVSLHLSAHYSSLVTVGFTCCDSLQVVDDVIVAGRNGPLSKSFLALPALGHFVSDEPLTRLLAEGLELPKLSPESVRYIPWRNIDWPWSTTSCMLFKRSIIDFVCAAKEFESIKIGSDNYLAQIINMLTGSIILDKQAVKYRIHGSNGFSKRPHLNGLLDHDRKANHTAQTLHVFMEDVERRFSTYIDIIDCPSRIAVIFALICCLGQDLGSLESFHRSLEEILRKNEDQWRPLVGEAVFIKMLGAVTTADPKGCVNAWSDEMPAAGYGSNVPGDGVSVSKLAIKAIAKEVWFERRQGGWPHKVRRWVERRLLASTTKRT